MQKDIMFQLPSGSFRFGKYLTDIFDFITSEQLSDAELWALFVKQYTDRVDPCDKGWRGEYWGKMMRGASLVYANTHSKELYRVLEKTVCDMLKTQDEYGRFSTYTREAEFDGWDLWCRKYILLGLQYFMEATDDAVLHKRITDALIRHTDYIIEKIGPASENKLEITKTSYCHGAINSASLLEPIVRMYNLTGDKKYLDFASYIVSTGACSAGNIFELAYEDRLMPCQYPVTKAYEMMSCFEGLIEYYRATGIEKWRIAAERFVRRIAETEITLIGSAGCRHEFFNHSSVEQFNTNQKLVMQETCVTVTWMKLCYQMLRLTGDSFYAGLMEKSIFNAMLGALNTERNISNTCLPFDSYSPLFSGVRGREIGGFKTMENNRYYGCCAAIGAAGLGLIGLCAVMSTADGIAINQYSDGEVSFVSPENQKVNITVSTDFPKSGRVIVKFDMPHSEKFVLRLRIPEWSKNTKLTLNGQEYPVIAGQYCTIDRIWDVADTVEISLDMNVYAVFSDEYGVPTEESHLISFRRGPLVLARDKRLGQDIDKPISPVIAADGSVTAVATDNIAFKYQVAFDIPNGDNTVIHTVDYASAGKTMDYFSYMAAWLPLK